MYLVTDKREFDRPFESVREFLEMFEPLPGRTMSIATAPPEGYSNVPERQITGSVIKDLKDVLLDNIKRIQQNKEYIPQAEAVKQNVDSIIDLAKTEIDYLSAMVKLNKI